MSSETSGILLSWLLSVGGLEAGFTIVFALILLKISAKATAKRVVGLAVLVGITCYAEKSTIQICLTSERPQWAATTASLLWVQLLSASELILVSRVDASQLPYYGKPDDSTLKSAASAIGLLWNMRRVGTRWQVKNVPSTASQQAQTRTSFVLRRIFVTLAAYLFVDIIVSLPPPDTALVRIDKATLFSLDTLGVEDVIFRVVVTISYWITTAVLNLFMTNVGAIISVLLQLSEPADCPPLYGSFFEAFTVRRFWGISWHQMFRSFLTGHADLIVDGTLPFLSRHSLVSRYARLAIAFVISGMIHYRADQVMGVSDVENGAVVFFLLHALVIMLEDAITPLASAVFPAPLYRVLGWLWVLSFFVWSSPIWIYANMRLGNDSASLLPIRFMGSWISQLAV